MEGKQVFRVKYSYDPEWSEPAIAMARDNLRMKALDQLFKTIRPGEWFGIHFSPIESRLYQPEPGEIDGEYLSHIKKQLIMEMDVVVLPPDPFPRYAPVDPREMDNGLLIKSAMGELKDRIRGRLQRVFQGFGIPRPKEKATKQP